jgi:hypothetical protein
MLRRQVVPTIVSFVLVGSITTEAPAAPSEDLADSHVIVGVERVASFISYESLSATPSGGGTSTTYSLTALSLFASDPAGINDVFYMVPRVGLDAVVSHVTLGGAAWVWTEVNITASSGGFSQDQPKATYWGIAPRVGYIVPLSNFVAFWPRVGVEYHSVNNTSVTIGGASAGGLNLNQLAGDIEGNLVITPVSHVGFDIEVFGAIPLTGSASSSQNTGRGSINISEVAVALTAGLVGYF